MWHQRAAPLQRKGRASPAHIVMATRLAAVEGALVATLLAAHYVALIGHDPGEARAMTLHHLLAIYTPLRAAIAAAAALVRLARSLGGKRLAASSSTLQDASALVLAAIIVALAAAAVAAAATTAASDGATST